MSPEDFLVDETLGFTPDGSGEHLFVLIRKRNLNTDQVARQFARHAGVRNRDVGYCGLKDRVAVTTQWLSIWLPGKADPDWSSIEDDNLQIVQTVRHGRKLQRGALKANRFQIVLRDVTADRHSIDSILEQIKEQGIPNYFGEQRFGRDGGNLKQAEALFLGSKPGGKKKGDRFLRSLYLSSARSFLFNEVLARRVRDCNWNLILPGEAAMLSGSRSYFVCDDLDNNITERLNAGDIHPSGPLWGRGDLASQGDVEQLEKSVLSAYPLFCEGLEKAGLKQERRALRVMVDDLHWTWLEDKVLELAFSLPAGCYATSLLREVCDYR